MHNRLPDAYCHENAQADYYTDNNTGLSLVCEVQALAQAQKPANETRVQLGLQLK